MTNLCLIHYHCRNLEQMKKKSYNNVKGLGYNPNSIDELKAHLLELWSNDSFRTELEKQGKENALRFRAENTFPQLHQIYKSL